MFKKHVLWVLFLAAISCGKDSGVQREIAEIPVEVDLVRFDQRFGKATPDSLATLKLEFPYLFPEQYKDPMWVEMINDSLNQELHNQVSNRFPDLSQIEQELHGFYQHIRYYFPDKPLPKVITLVSEVDYRNQVIWADSLLLVSLDTYLGREHPFYEGIQDYFRSGFEPEFIVVDAARSFAENELQYPTSRLFLEEMVYFGKLLYLKDLLIPFKSDAEKIGYSSGELEWAAANEEQIWRYFVERELLFSSDPQLGPRFLYPAPFSKFYLKLDNETPARLGQYLGWQMVRQFVERTDANLEQVLSSSGEDIFNNSNYKPRR